MDKTAFLTDVPTLLRRAREDIDEGSVAGGYLADRATVLKLLNESLATELVCVLRYRRHHFMARGIHSQSLGQEFLDHSNEEQGHADEIAARIVQLGGTPDFAPDGLTRRSHAEYVEGHSLSSMITENLVAERIAIDSYRGIIQYLGEQDSTTRRMIEGILAVEEKHADELADLLATFPAERNGKKRSGESKMSVCATSTSAREECGQCSAISTGVRVVAQSAQAIA